MGRSSEHIKEEMRRNNKQNPVSVWNWGNFLLLRLSLRSAASDMLPSGDHAILLSFQG